MLIFWISLCFFKIFSVQLSLVGLLVLLGQCDRLERVRGLPQRETKEFSAKDFFFFGSFILFSWDDPIGVNKLFPKNPCDFYCFLGRVGFGLALFFWCGR